MALPGPVLLLIAPLLGSIVLLPLRRWRWAAAVAGTIITGVLWLMLTTVPLDPTDIELATRLFAGDTYMLWEQPLILTEAVQSLMLLVYILSGLLFLLSGIWPPGYNFVVVALAALSPLAAALMIRPFAFGAIFMFIAFAFLVLIIQSERAGTVRPALRYLLIGLLATCLFLIAGWMVGPEQTGLQASAARLLVVAFAMFMAGFPFYIWVIPVARRTPLLARIFILGIVPLIVTLFLFDLRQDHPWLAQDAQFMLWLRWSGLLTVLVAGLSALTTDPRRLLSSLLLLDIGMAILVLALGGRETAISLHLARMAGLLLAGIGLQQDSRWSRLLFIYGCASLLGFPLTPGFFGRWPLFSQLPDVTFTLLLLAGLGGGLLGLWHYLHQQLDSPPATAQPIA
jgi:formate hydrogenlyase subunit 3/multisubunit Na+/H+ antiporter MnhD subunit